MDDQTAGEIADLRYQLAQLRTALGVSDSDQAESRVMEMAETLNEHGQQISQLQQQMASAQQSIITISGSLHIL